MEPAARFVSLIREPDGGADLELLAGLLGASFEPSADLAATGRDLDELADRHGNSFESIMAGLFGNGLLRGNAQDYSDPRNSYLHQVLIRRLGLPITLSVVAIEVGRRAGVPIVGVGLPGHFIVGDESSGRFADPFMRGRIYGADEVGAAWQRLTRSAAPLDPAMLEPTPSRSIVLRMLNNLKNTMLQRKDEHGLAVLARLRGAFPELTGERVEHARWMRHWN